MEPLKQKIIFQEGVQSKSSRMIKDPKLRKFYVEIIKETINKLTQQFTQQTFDVNSCIRFINEKMLNDIFLQKILGTTEMETSQLQPNQITRKKLPEQQIFQEDEQSNQKLQNRQNNQNNALQLQMQKSSLFQQKQSIIFQSIQQDLTKLAWVVMNSPKIWIEMLENQEFISYTDTINLNELVNTKIYYRFLKQCQKQGLSIFLQIIQDSLETSTMNQQKCPIKNRLLHLLQLIGQIICECYKNGAQMIITKVQFLQRFTQKQPLMNTLLLYKIMRDFSAQLTDKLQQMLRDSIFRHVKCQYTQIFAKYIIQKYEILKLNFHYAKQEFGKPTIGTESCQQINYVDWEQIVDRIMNGCKVQIRKAYCQDMVNAVLIQYEQQISEQAKIKQSFIVFLDQMGKPVFLNTKIIRKKWKVSSKHIKTNNFGEFLINMKVLQYSQEQTHSIVASSLQKDQIYYPISCFCQVQGNLGKSLTQIRKSRGFNDFVNDLSKRTVVQSSLKVMLSRAPLIGYFFIAGSYSYTFYNIFKNQSTDNRKKFEEISNVAITATTSIGSSIAGAIIGQTLIPVPVFGALVGSVIGGYLGQKGGKKISKTLDKERFQDTVHYLSNNMEKQGYWVPNNEIFKHLRLKEIAFANSIPNSLKKKNSQLNEHSLWLTLICFTVCSVFQSQRISDNNFQKAKQLQSKNKKSQKKDKSIEGQEELYQRQEIQKLQAYKQIQKEDSYEFKIDLTPTMLLFQRQNVRILKYLTELQKLVLPIIVKQ